MGWLSGWTYRRGITITEQSGSTLTDYQVRIELNSSNFDFSKANVDGSDIRFTEDDGTTLLNYWIEKWDSSNEEAVIWVKVPSLPANEETMVYLYYGNSEAESESDGESVFDFFDDFDGASLDTSKWDIIDTADYHIADSVLYIDETNDWLKLQSKQTFNNANGWVFETKAKYTSGAGTKSWFFYVGHGELGYASAEAFGYSRYENSWRGAHNGVNSNFNGPAIQQDRWYILTLKMKGAHTEWAVDGVTYKTFDDTDIETLPVSIGSSNKGAFDWVRVRKYAEQEPSASVRSEGLPISGIVKLSNGTPVQGATVISIREDTYEIVDVTTSESDGSYTLAAAGGVNNTVIVIPSTEDQNGDIKCHIQPA